MTALAVVLILPVHAEAGPDSEPEPEPDRAGKEQIGPSWDPARAVWADEDARMLVRGDRPEGGSIHIAYAPPVVQWDRKLRADLAAFELDHVPVAGPRQTIVDAPPEDWMLALDLPDLPVRWNAATIEYLRFFKDDPKGRRMIAAWLNRMGRYEDRLRTILRETGVPEDLVYVAMVESGFDPAARSGVGAAGMWQFMEPTGRVYGLGSEYWTDDRLDFERASYAAATYLADLHTRFGSWELALAAYNAGYGLVVQSIRANNTNNYWALSEIENGLPEQTSSYVPKILAAAIVGHNRKVFGVEGKPDPARELIDVDVPAGTTLDELATAIAVDAKLLAELNAHYLRGRVPPDGGPAPVRIPREAHARFTALGESLRVADQPWTTFEVWLGDDLESIALAHGTTEKQLRKLNDIHDSGEIVGGTVLVVPTPPAADGSATPSKPLLPLVAVPELSVPRHHTLVVFRVTRATAEQAVAKGFGVAWSQVVAWNDLDPHARLVDGQYLQIIVPDGFDPAAAKIRARSLSEVRKVVRGTVEHVDALLAERDLVRRAYKVHKGETLAKVAKKFEMSLGSLARINGVAREHQVATGDELLLYIPKSLAKSLTKSTHKPGKPRPTTLTAELEVAEQLAEDPGTKPKKSSRSKPRAASTAETSKLPGQPD